MKTIKAVVGILRNETRQILISKRQKHQFMADFWELPGGKIEPFETPKQALIRELFEELNVIVSDLSLHQTMIYDYPERTVELSIYRVNQYQNTPIGAENQPIKWCDIGRLEHYQLLPTMRSIIHSITLPDKYWITPSIQHQSADWTQKFDAKIAQGIKLIQLRSKTKLAVDFVKNLYQKCQKNQVKLLLNTPDKTFHEAYCDGWHLTTAEALSLKKRPCSLDKLLSVSTHNLNEAKMGQKIGADFVVISPVKATQTHPDSAPIGWQSAKKVVDKLNIPVYFLGGMTLDDLDKTRKLGALGIAGVSAF
jgi:8-oxo-dGTP diphosphatase